MFANSRIAGEKILNFYLFHNDMLPISPNANLEGITDGMPQKDWLLISWTPAFLFYARVCVDICLSGLLELVTSYLGRLIEFK